MDSPKKQAAKLLRENKNRRRRLTVVACLALLVATGTVAALKLHGQAMAHTRRVLDCSFAPHVHTTACYPGGDTTAQPICGLADVVAHVHNEDCMQDGELVCPLPELEPHTHTDACMTTERQLVCTLPESPAVPGHTHTEACYTVEEVTTHTCGLEEHTHTDACYAPVEAPAETPAEGTEGAEGEAAAPAAPAEPQLICTLPEHTHTEECTTTEQVSTLTCTLPEGEGSEGHTHTDACYQEKTVYTCGKLGLHTHTDACYNAEGALVCGQLQLVEHTHTDACFHTEELDDDEVPQLTPAEPRQAVFENADIRVTADYDTTTRLPDGLSLQLVDADTPAPPAPPQEITITLPEDKVLDSVTVEVVGTVPAVPDETTPESTDPAPAEDATGAGTAAPQNEPTDGTDPAAQADVADPAADGAAADLTNEGPATADPAAPADENADSQAVAPAEPPAAAPADDANAGDAAADNATDATAPSGDDATADDAANADSDATTPADGTDAATNEGSPALSDNTSDPAANAGEEGTSNADETTPADGNEDESAGEPAGGPAGDTAPSADESTTPAAPVYTDTELEPEDLVRPAFMVGGTEQLPATAVTFTVQYLDEDGQPIGDEEKYEFVPGGSLPSFAATAPRFAKQCATDQFVVTATYTAAAKIPAEAQLRAFEIVDEAELDARAEEYRQALGSPRAKMQLLLDIGFWLDEQELQPAAPVTITVQLLGENGLPDGDPVTIVHFGQTGTQVLPATVDADSSTAEFEMDNFSPVAIGTAPAAGDDGRVSLDNVFEWFDGDTLADSLFRVTFHVKGVAAPKGEAPAQGADAAQGEDATAQDTDSAAQDENAAAPTGEDGETFANEEDTTAAAPADGQPQAAPADGEADANKQTTDGTTSAVTDTAADANDAPLANGEEVDGEDANGETDAEPAPLANPALLDWQVQTLAEDDEAYQAYQQYAEKTPAELLQLMVMRYALTYDGVPMDLSDCEITVEVTPTQTVVEAAENYDPGEAATLDMQTGEMSIAPEANTAGMVVSAVTPATLQADAELDALLEELPQAEDGEELELDTDTQTALEELQQAADVDGSFVLGADEEESQQEQSMTFTFAAAAPTTTKAPSIRAGDDTLSFILQGQANPTFMVEYLAELDVVSTTDRYQDDRKNNSQYTTRTGNKLDYPANNPSHVPEAGEVKKSLPVIDTSGKSLPNNDKTQKVFDLELTDSEGGLNGQSVKIKTKKDLQQIYTSLYNVKYFSKPGLHYFNILEENNSYELVNIKVLDENRVQKGEYSYSDNIRFSNRLSGQQSDGYSYICIAEGDIVQLHYKTADPKQFNAKATFYDYDISNGGPNDTVIQTSNYGINSDENYKGTGIKYAFGNRNCGTSFGDLLWNGNKLNAGNHDKAILGSTFGLVQKMTADGQSIVFSSGVNGIDNLFGSGNGDTKGKHTYGADPNANPESTSHLTFTRVGDTYTLSAAHVFENGQEKSSVTRLDEFVHPGNYTNIWTNGQYGFWPMDKITNQDGNMGLTVRYHNQNKKYHELPLSDDRKEAHNCFFGLNFGVEFTLKDYIGPLNYYFFGDDDMWVFLSEVQVGADGKKTYTPVSTTKNGSGLICDIGGVHSSVGEYVDLWDYIEKGDPNSNKTYALHFFYTERGASGSTCWMQFTLPSVTGATRTESNYGSVKIEKTVEKILVNGLNDPQPTVYDTGEIFLFKLSLPNYYGDDYSCKKHVIWEDGSISDIDRLAIHGDNYFSLRAGEWLEISNLPEGAQYTVTEIGAAPSSAISGRDPTTGEFTAGQSISLSNDYVYEMYVNNTLCENKSYTGTVEKNKTIALKVDNRFRAFQLPKTGGEGVQGYLVGGAALVVLAGFGLGWYYRRKHTVRT